jgi:hypothetical protein
VSAQSGDDTIDASTSTMAVRIDGGADDDLIYASLGDDVITDPSGDDIIFGGLGNDYIDAGADNDIVIADIGRVEKNLPGDPVTVIKTADDPTKGGNDIVFLGDGNDIGLGGAGSDLIYGEGGRDIIFGDFAQLTVSRDGTRDLQATLATFGGNDTIIGGEGFDILVGGAGVDDLRGSLSDDILVGNYVRIVDRSDFKIRLFASDPSNRDVISARVVELFNNESPLMERRNYASDIIVSDDEDLSGSTWRTDIALRMTPLLNGEALSRLSDSELQDFLRALPVTQTANPVGYEVAPSIDTRRATQDNGVNEPGRRPGDLELFDQSPDIDDQILGEGSEQPGSSATGNSAAFSDEAFSYEALSDEASESQDPLAAPMAASMLLAARVSRKRGWSVGWLGDGQQQVQGDLGELRKVQSERQFKVWRKH